MPLVEILRYIFRDDRLAGFEQIEILPSLLSGDPERDVQQLPQIGVVRRAALIVA